MGGGSAFSDMTSPTVMVQVGAPGSSGIMEISDIVFATRGPGRCPFSSLHSAMGLTTIRSAPGAIVLEWNVNSPTQGGAGMWDSHVRLGGGKILLRRPGGLLSAQPAYRCLLSCRYKPSVKRYSDNKRHISCSSLSRASYHVASQCVSGGKYTCLPFCSSEQPSTRSILQGTWLWLADHDLDATSDSAQLTLWSGRGLLSESQGPVWLIGTASEHHVIYQYNLNNASNHYMGLIQTETVSEVVISLRHTSLIATALLST